MFDKIYAKRLKAYKQMANAIFESDNYEEVCKRDLLEAEKEIVISSPAISSSKVYELINLLKEKQNCALK